MEDVVAVGVPVGNDGYYSIGELDYVGTDTWSVG